MFLVDRLPVAVRTAPFPLLAASGVLEPVAAKLGAKATLAVFADADHSFHVPARSGRKDAQVLGEVLDAFAGWLARHA